MDNYPWHLRMRLISASRFLWKQAFFYIGFYCIPTSESIIFKVCLKSPDALLISCPCYCSYCEATCKKLISSKSEDLEEPISNFLFELCRDFSLLNSSKFWFQIAETAISSRVWIKRYISWNFYTFWLNGIIATMALCTSGIIKF